MHQTHLFCCYRTLGKGKGGRGTLDTTFKLVDGGIPKLKEADNEAVEVKKKLASEFKKLQTTYTENFYKKNIEDEEVIKQIEVLANKKKKYKKLKKSEYETKVTEMKELTADIKETTMVMEIKTMHTKMKTVLETVQTAKWTLHSENLLLQRKIQTTMSEVEKALLNKAMFETEKERWDKDIQGWTEENSTKNKRNKKKEQTATNKDEDKEEPTPEETATNKEEDEEANSSSWSDIESDEEEEEEPPSKKHKSK